jgi:hypothetical protein
MNGKALPIADCQLPIDFIADCQLPIANLFWVFTNIDNGNRKSIINPRVVSHCRYIHWPIADCRFVLAIL